MPIAAWWAALTGAQIGPGPDGAPRWLALDDMLWKFVRTPDVRVVKNRWHWDVYAHEPDLVAAGASVLREPDGDTRWTVLADPDGNDFSAFTPTA